MPEWDFISRTPYFGKWPWQVEEHCTDEIFVDFFRYFWRRPVKKMSHYYVLLFSVRYAILSHEKYSVKSISVCIWFTSLWPNLNGLANLSQPFSRKIAIFQPFWRKYYIGIDSFILNAYFFKNSHGNFRPRISKTCFFTHTCLYYLWTVKLFTIFCGRAWV